MKYGVFAFVLSGVLLVSGCAVEKTSYGNEEEKMFLDAWLSLNHPDARLAGAGIYVLYSDIKGEGETVEKPCYARVTYTARDLDGNVTATSDSTMAKQLGEFNPSFYYDPRTWYVADNAIQKGLEDMLSGMAAGDTITALIPGWLQTLRRFNNEHKYFEEITGNTHQIYSLKVNEVVEDINEWQISRIKEYYEKEYPGEAEPKQVYEDIDGFFYRTDPATPGEGDIDEMHTDTTVYIHYTGKLLNGQVFDTTDERVAVDNNIYSSSKDYGPVEVTMSADSTGITMDGSSIISGFALTVWQMKPMEKGTGLFYSPLGYGANGSGSVIPEYAPLIFEIEMVENPDGDEE